MNEQIQQALSYLIENSDGSVETAEAIAKIEGYIYGLLEQNKK